MKPTILIVEDDDCAAALFTRVLESHYVVTWAQTVSSALANLRQGSFDLVILDWNLGNECGLDVLLAMRQTLPSAPPVLVATAASDPEVRRLAMNAGAAAVVRKPMEPDEIRKLVKGLIQQPGAESSVPASAVSATESRAVLLVEDDDLVRDLAAMVLRDQGFEVVEAVNGLDAMDKALSGAMKFDVLITDVVMPQIGGPELAERLLKLWPNLQVLFVSGYPQGGQNAQGAQKLNYLNKPYSADALVARTRAMFDCDAARKES